MSRCEYDTVLCRVFCVTLLAVALTFTLILTNVFIDIDSLLTTSEKEREQVQQEASQESGPQIQEQGNDILYQQDDSTYEPNTDVFYDYRPEGDDDSRFRTKRSLDTKSFQHHINNPKMKEVLTNQLSSLLEELDAEESQATHKMHKNIEQDKINRVKEGAKRDKEVKNTELLHLAMHNILLQGIYGHMDFNVVYKRIHNLLKIFETKNDDLDKDIPKIRLEVAKDLQMSEGKFFEELTKCEELRQQISEVTGDKDSRKNSQYLEREEVQDLGPSRRSYGASDVNTHADYWDTYHEAKESKTPQMLIKTIIDIKTLKSNNNKTNIDANNIKGLIKLVYNGKPIKFSRIGEEEEAEVKSNREDKSHESDDKEIQHEMLSDTHGNVVDAFIDDAIINYLKKRPKVTSLKAQRLKRSVKIKLKEHSTEKPKTTKKKDDDDVYVEIETHFDSSGANGEKKKKLIKSLVEKIQKAVHANIDSKKTNNQKNDITKRLQAPLENKREIVISKIEIPSEIFQREMSPIISKTVRQNQDSPQVFDKTGDIWKGIYAGPRFLSHNKAINSGEAGTVNLAYSNVMKHSGIPQRLQQPLNTDNIDDQSDVNYFNIGDLKFYIKEIDDTGFSIGFNQYVGEAPDPESMKLFSGIQHLIKTYDENDGESHNRNYVYNNEKKNASNQNHDVKKRDIQSRYKEVFDRISKIQDGDHHENEYKVIFDKQFIPYDSYSEIIEDQDKKIQVAIKKDDNHFEDSFNKNDQTDLPILVDDNIFSKSLKPSEIFGIANLLERKKRSPRLKVKKFSNLNTRRKSKFSTFINTSRKSKRLVVRQNRRSKRQVDKIRIIATDSMPDLGHLDDNVFVMSEENNGGRNSLHEVEVQDDDSEPENVYMNTQQTYQSGYHPLFSEFSNPRHYNVFTARSRHNALMPKYPHLFIDEMTRTDSRENGDNPVFYNKLLDSYTEYKNKEEVTKPPFLASAVPLSIQEPIVPEYPERIPKTNYKLTVKIVPKNHSNLDSGFKEIHTSINKSINRNGLIYSSQVNVSELSKVENSKRQDSTMSPESYNFNQQTFNVQRMPEVTEKSYGATTSFYPLVKHIREQQEKMKQLLKQHRIRIDAELDTLKKEKQNIESLVPGEKKLDVIDVVLPLNPPQMLHLNRDEAGQLITSALMKLHDAPQLNDISSGNIKNCSYTTVEPTTETLKTTTIEPEKMKILKSIQHNENLTNAILFKMDRNTNLLQHFLQKLTDRLANPQPRFEPRRKEVKRQENEPFFGNVMPNLDVKKPNSTLMSIPFVYAYQQPYPLPAKPNSPVASVVYQGHIHTNAMNKPFKIDDVGKSVVPDKREVNKTKFFYDSFEDKLNLHKTYEIPRLKHNSSSSEYSTI